MKPWLVHGLAAGALVVFLSPAAGLAQTAPDPATATPLPQARLVGVETGEPEKDSFGMEGGGGPTCRPVFSHEARAFGPTLGDPEKDSVGFETVGQEDCPTIPAR